MWPISPGEAVAAHLHHPFDNEATADAGTQGDHQHVVSYLRALPPSRGVPSASTAKLASFSTNHTVTLRPGNGVC